MNNPYLPTMTIIKEKIAPKRHRDPFQARRPHRLPSGSVHYADSARLRRRAPFSLTGDLEVCVRDSGHLTHRAARPRPGGHRWGGGGPLGTSFDMAPLGPAGLHRGRVSASCRCVPSFYPGPDWCYWAQKTRGELVFPELADKMRTDDEGHGFLPDLIRETELPKGAVCMLCGPGGMYRPVAKALMEQGVTPERIIVSLERNMSCGIGKCGHCRVGGLRVCKDGPVFSYAQIADKEGLI